MADEKKTILLVDDDFDFRVQYRITLEKAGYHVIEAEGRESASRLLGESRPDLALVDVMMEESDSGFALCYEIRRLYPGLPIILVTGVTGETGLKFDAASQDAREWVKADLVLDKPVRPEELLNEVERLLKG